MPDTSPPTYRRSLTQEMVRDTLRGHIPDSEYADRLIAIADSILADIRWLKAPPAGATTEDLLAGVRGAASRCRSFGELLLEMPDGVAAAIPEELRFEVKELAAMFKHFGRFGECVHEGLQALATWAEETDNG
jgi:hypothetical protein